MSVQHLWSHVTLGCEQSGSNEHLEFLVTLASSRAFVCNSTVYLIVEFCSGGDLSQYIRARGKIETLQYSPRPGDAAIFYPRPKAGGLDQKAVRTSLIQLGAPKLNMKRAIRYLHIHYAQLAPSSSCESAISFIETSNLRWVHFILLSIEI